LSSFCIYGDVVGVTDAGENQQVIFPRGSWSFVEQLTVSINGSVVENIVGYHHVHQLFHDMQGGSRFATMAPLQHTRNFNPLGVDTTAGNQASDKGNMPMVGIRQSRGARQGVSTLASVPARAETNFFAQSVEGTFTQNALPMAWCDWLGFLRCGKWLDTSTLGVCEITIKFASDRILKRSDTGSGAVTYRVQNLRAFCQVASVDDGVLYNAMAARLQQSPLTIPYKKFVTFNSRTLTGTGSVNFSLSTPSLDAVYSMLLDPNPQTFDPLAVERLPLVLKDNKPVQGIGADIAAVTAGELTAVLDTMNHTHLFPGDSRPAPYFMRYSASKSGPTAIGSFGNGGAVMSTQLRINSVAYPSWPASVDEQYYLALNTFRAFDDNIGVAPDMTYENWHNFGSFFSHRLSYGKGLDWISGIDSRGINTQCVIEYTVSPPVPGNTTGAFNFRPFVIAETTSFLQVSAYRSISIV
jgi:hypothetical protein